MNKLFKRLKRWCWWNFKATETHKCNHDIKIYGSSFMKNGERISPKDFYNN